MIGPVFAVLFALLLGIASVFSRRGLENGSFRVLLVTSLVIGSPIFLIVTVLSTGFADTPLLGAVYAATGGIIGSTVARAMYFLGIDYLGPGKSLSITATSPLFAAFLAWLVLDETVTPLVVAGTLAVVVGIFFLSKDIRSQTEDEEYSILVVSYPLVGAVLAAVTVILRKLALNAGIAPIEAGSVNMVAGLLAVSPLVATRWREEIVETDRSALLNFVIASTIMAVGFILYFYGLRTTNASIFFPLVQTQPIFAVVISAVFLGQLEIITRWSILGSSIIVGGATFVVIG